MRMNYDKNPIVLNRFLKYLLNVKNYSMNTVESYCLDLLCFFDFLKDYLEWEVAVKDFNVFILTRVEEADVIAFLVYLNFNRDNTGATRKRRLSCIKTFYRWLFSVYPSCDEKLNPAKEIPSITLPFRLPRYLSLNEAKRISTIFTVENCVYPLRNNMIIGLFLNTGLRLSELCGLNVGDVHVKEKYIRVAGKGGKERSVPINESMKGQLIAYLKASNKDKEMVCLDSPLFVGHQGKRLGMDGVAGVCKKAFALMGLEECGYSTHSLRHTAATILYEYGKCDVLCLKKFLGHSSIEATQIYTHVSAKRVRDAVNRNPLSDFCLEEAV